MIVLPIKQFSLVQNEFPFSLMSLIALLFVMTGAVYADEQSCGELSGDERTLCDLMARCNAIDDSSRRWSCLRAASRLRDSLSDTASIPSGTESAGPELETSTIFSETASKPSGESRPEKPVIKEVESETAASKEEDLPAVETRQILVDVFDIPPTFMGKVSGVRRLVRDRQLIAVNGNLLFEGDVANSSAVLEGDVIEVARLSSLFKSERFRLIPRSKRAIMARRLRCESPELLAETRSKCGLLGLAVAGP